MDPHSPDNKGPQPRPFSSLPKDIQQELTDAITGKGGRWTVIGDLSDSRDASMISIMRTLGQESEESLANRAGVRLEDLWTAENCVEQCGIAPLRKIYEAFGGFQLEAQVRGMEGWSNDLVGVLRIQMTSLDVSESRLAKKAGISTDALESILSDGSDYLFGDLKKVADILEVDLEFRPPEKEKEI